ncbi:MAG TPA: GGDEF domain-containing protein [Vicinamibacteria bacterium]
MLPRRHTYPLAAMVLALGAPLGLRGLEAVTGEPPLGAWAYGYVTVSTLIAFSVFGHVLGRQADRLLELARTDDLTGLHNTRAFRERLREEEARVRRYPQPLSLLLLDLDGLKAINDAQGHRAGDAALARVAAEMRAEARATDCCSRWGGDEFAVLAPNTAAEPALALAERIRTRIAATAGASRLTVSVGVATLDAATGFIMGDDLVRAADDALYRAKGLGGNRACAASGPPR